MRIPRPTVWLSNAVVADPDGSNRAGCWVEVVPTGRVRDARDGAPAGEPVLDAGGIELDPTPHSGVAEALLAAIVKGDRAAADALYTDDLVVWHNHDAVERDKAESLELIDAIARDFVSVEATDVRRDHLADGYVQRTTFHVVGAAGDDELIDTMMRVWVRDARITRIEEYALGDIGRIGS